MSVEDEYVALTERMREIEQEIARIDRQIEEALGYRHRWNVHISYVRREVSEEAYNLVKEIFMR